MHDNNDTAAAALLFWRVLHFLLLRGAIVNVGPNIVVNSKIAKYVGVCVTVGPI